MPVAGWATAAIEHREAERGREVAAAVERRVEVLHLPEEEDRADERRDAEQLEQRQRAPHPLDPGQTSASRMPISSRKARVSVP